MFLAEPLAHAWSTLRSSKRMLVAVSFLDLAICLPAALYVASVVHAEGAHRPDALELAKRLDLDFMADLRADGAFDGAMAVLCGATFLLFFLVRPFVLSAFVGLAATRRRVHFGQFARDGGVLYWKFLRLSVVALLVAYLVAIGAKPLLEQVDRWAQPRLEATAERYTLVTHLVVLGTLAVVSMVFDYARVGMRLHRGPGVLAEVGRAALFVLQHPARTLAFCAVSYAIEAGAILVCGWLVQVADGGYLITSAIVLLIVQFLVTLREAARLFHLAGAWQIRAGEAGEERAEERMVAAEPDQPDVLRVPLPWNARP
jgi:hypothetical protein